MPPTNATTGRRPRFTIGMLMVTIAGFALIMAAVRPLARLLLPLYPEFSRLLQRLATIEMAFIGCGLLITAYAVVKLMAEDEQN